MKKLFIILIALLLVLMSLSSCSQDKDTDNGTDASTETNGQNNETTAPNNSETNSPETNIPETNTPETNVPETNAPETKKTTSEIAKEVIAGKWGNGNERQEKLEAAGYDYLAVQEMVYYLLNPDKYLAEEPKTQIEMTKYMDFLIDYFNKPYKAGDNISDVLLPALCMETLYHTRGSLDIAKLNPDKDMQMEVKGEDLRTIATLLISDKVDLNTYNTEENKAITANVTTHQIGRTVYTPGKDQYIVRLGFSGSWGNSNYSVNPNIPLQISETDTTITVIANIGGTDGYSFDDKNTQTLEYTFNKVVYQNFTFYQLVEVK